jgi:hypothetical protein
MYLREFGLHAQGTGHRAPGARAQGCFSLGLAHVGAFL